MSASSKQTVFIICTSASELAGHKTGVWLEELASPYYIFKKAGFNVAICSVSGGPIPLDQASLSGGFFTDAAKKFMHDAEAVGQLSHSTPIGNLRDTHGKVAGADALFLPGGHGTCADFVGNAQLKALVEDMIADKKFVGAVCHGPMALVECINKETKKPLVEGLTVSAFTDSEEAAVGLTKKVPFLLESKLESLGAKIKKGADWGSCTSQDGYLITGQNPQSSSACAELLVKVLSA
eukprot:g3334.t1